MKPRRGARWLPAACGAATVGAVLLFLLSFEEPWSLRGENKVSFFPMYADAWRQWLTGHFPQWTSGMFGGFPLFAGSQSAALYLPHALAFGSTPAPHWRALDVSLALHAGLLAAGCVRLLLHLGARAPAAIFGAALVLAGRQVVYWTNFVPMFEAIAWWPWLFLAADRLGDPDRRSCGAIVLGAGALAAQVYVGYVEYALYSGCFAAAWTFASATRLSIAARLRRVALLALSAALLAAPQLLPTALALEVGARTGPGFEPLSLGSSGIAALVDPREGGSGPWLSSLFLGGATLALAVCAVALRARRGAFLCGLAVATGLLGLGPATPLYGWLKVLPGFDLFRTPYKFFVATEICVAMLAALGLAALAKRGSPRAVGAAILLGTLALAEHGTHLALQLPGVATPHVHGEVRIPGGLAGFESFLPELLPASPGSTAPPPRVLHVAWPGSFGSLGEVYGVESILGSSPALLSERQARLLRRRPFLDRHRWIDRDWLALLGVELVVVRGSCSEFDGRGLQMVRVAHGECLLRNPDARPRFELLARSRRVRDEEAELRRVLEHPGAPVPVVAPAAPHERNAWSAGPLAPGERVESLAYRPGAFRLRVTSGRARLLLIREARSPGWRAQVDGRLAPILPAGGLFFAVPVPAGETLVEIEYRAPGIGTGLVLATGWVIGAGVVCRRGAGGTPASDL